MPKVFSPRTLGKFEDASASIPLRQIDRAFVNADVRLGEDPGGPEGARRTQFRRYVAGVDQHDPQQLERLGDAFGALIGEVAASKIDFLVKAAESDSFCFSGGVFRRVEITAGSFTVARLEDLASIGDGALRLHLLANDNPRDAIAGAKELVESLCRMVLRLLAEPPPNETSDLADIADAALRALGLVSDDIDGADEGAGLVRRCLQQLGAFATVLGEFQDFYDSGQRRDGKWKGLSTSHARLAAGAAVTFAGFIADTYVERAASEKVDGGESRRGRKR